ncbi:MAG: hypothetical protein ACREQZ_03025 [Woeseiaceae bacterium]
MKLVIASAGVLAFANAVAHGEDWELRMTGKKVGAYDLTVRTSPKQPRTGRLHIEAQVIDPQTLAYVDDAKVSALARLDGGAAAQAGPVPSRYRRPWHEIDLVLTRSGAWEVQLVVDDPRARGAASFLVDILPEDTK